MSKGTGRNQATPEGVMKGGGVGPDERTMRLLEEHNKNVGSSESDPIKRLGLGKKIREINPDFNKPE